MSGIGTKNFNKIFISNKEVENIYVSNNKVYETTTVPTKTTLLVNNTSGENINATLNIYKDDANVTIIKLNDVQVESSTTSGSQDISLNIPTGQNKITLEGGGWYFDGYCLGNKTNNSYLIKVRFGQEYSTRIGSNVFNNCLNLASIKLPSSLTAIQTYAFSHCENLRDIKIPNSITVISAYAFEYCYKLSNVILPNLLQTIGNYSFRYCSELKNITIPNSVTGIGTGAFVFCSSLTSITIPNNVTSIGNSAFAGCVSLVSFVSNGTYTTLDNGRLLMLGTEINSAAMGGLSSYTIPNGVTSIGVYAFSGRTNLKSISISSSVTTIKNSAFQASGLTSIVIPQNVTDITHICYQCEFLETVYVYTTSSSTKATTLTRAWCQSANPNVVIHALSTLNATSSITAFGQYWNYIDADTQATTIYDL